MGEQLWGHHPAVVSLAMWPHWGFSPSLFHTPPGPTPTPILKMIHRQHMFLSQFCFLMGPQKRPHGELWSKHIKSTKQSLPAIDFLCVCYLEASLRFSLLSAADWFSVSLVFVIVATGQAENEKWSWKCQMAQGGDLETASASWLGITSLLGIWG